MVSGTPPFAQATKDDFIYKFLVANKWSTFWQFHAKNKPGTDSFYSDGFKDLVESLLNYDTTKRYNIAHVIEHPWFNGPVASHKEVLAEFRQRKEINDEEEQKERSAKK